MSLIQSGCPKSREFLCTSSGLPCRCFGFSFPLLCALISLKSSYYSWEGHSWHTIIVHHLWLPPVFEGQRSHSPHFSERRPAWCHLCLPKPGPHTQPISWGYPKPQSPGGDWVSVEGPPNKKKEFRLLPAKATAQTSVVLPLLWAKPRCFAHLKGLPMPPWWQKLEPQWSPGPLLGPISRQKVCPGSGSTCSDRPNLPTRVPRMAFKKPSSRISLGMQECKDLLHHGTMPPSTKTSENRGPPLPASS